MQLADVLIFADEDKIYGINQGYYPDIKNAIDSGSLLVLPYNGWRDTELRLKAIPHCDGKDVYIRNPYSNCFIPTSDNEILDAFVKDKSHVIKEALVWLGAKDIVVVETVEDKDTVNASLDAASKVGLGKGSLKANLKRLASVDITTLIESHDPLRKPKPYEKVDSYLRNHGLANETMLTVLAERLREDGLLSGSERYAVTYLNEIQFALNVLAGFDYKVFSSSLDFSLEHNHVHSITKVLDIKF